MNRGPSQKPKAAKSDIADDEFIVTYTKDLELINSMLTLAKESHDKGERYDHSRNLIGSIVHYSIAANTLHNINQLLRNVHKDKLESMLQSANTQTKNRERGEHIRLLLNSTEALQNEVKTHLSVSLSRVQSLQKLVREQQMTPIDDEQNDQQAAEERKQKEEQEAIMNKFKPIPIEQFCKDDAWFDNIIGLKTAKEEMMRGFVYPQLFPTLFPKLSRGILLYGMPGVGKTMLAKAAINELTYKNKTTTDDKNTITTEVLFYAPTAAELKGKYVGESEKSIKALFDRASNEAAKKQKEDPTKKVISLIFLDEVESIAGSRQQDSTGLTMTTLNTLLQQMDGMNTKDNVVVMAATNYPWQLDSAFLRRFSTTIGIQLPTMGDIYDLLSLRMTKHFAQGILDPEHALTYDEANKMCIRLPPQDKHRWEKVQQKICFGFLDSNKNTTRPYVVQVPATDFKARSLYKVAELCADGKYSNSDVDRLVGRVVAQLGETALNTKTFYPTLINGTLLFQSTLNLDSNSAKKLHMANLIFTIHNESLPFVRLQTTENGEIRTFMHSVHNAPWLGKLLGLGFKDVFVDVSRNEKNRDNDVLVKKSFMVEQKSTDDNTNKQAEQIDLYFLFKESDLVKYVDSLNKTGIWKVFDNVKSFASAIRPDNVLAAVLGKLKSIVVGQEQPIPDITIGFLKLLQGIYEPATHTYYKNVVYETDNKGAVTVDTEVAKIEGLAKLLLDADPKPKNWQLADANILNMQQQPTEHFYAIIEQIPVKEATSKLPQYLLDAKADDLFGYLQMALFPEDSDGQKYNGDLMELCAVIREKDIIRLRAVNFAFSPAIFAEAQTVIKGTAKESDLEDLASYMANADEFLQKYAKRKQ